MLISSDFVALDLGTADQFRTLRFLRSLIVNFRVSLCGLIAPPKRVLPSNWLHH